MGLGHTVFSQQTLRIHSCRRLHLKARRPARQTADGRRAPLWPRRHPRRGQQEGSGGPCAHLGLVLDLFLILFLWHEN